MEPLFTLVRTYNGRGVFYEFYSSWTSSVRAFQGYGTSIDCSSNQGLLANKLILLNFVDIVVVVFEIRFESK